MIGQLVAASTGGATLTVPVVWILLAGELSLLSTGAGRAAKTSGGPCVIVEVSSLVDEAFAVTAGSGTEAGFEVSGLGVADVATVGDDRRNCITIKIFHAASPQISSVAVLLSEAANPSDA